MAKWLYDRWPGYSVEDCDCKYCLYYGGKLNGEIRCLVEECVCKEELRAAVNRDKNSENT